MAVEVHVSKSCILEICNTSPWGGIYNQNLGAAENIFLWRVIFSAKNYSNYCWWNLWILVFTASWDFILIQLSHFIFSATLPVKHAIKRLGINFGSLAWSFRDEKPQLFFANNMSEVSFRFCIFLVRVHCTVKIALKLAS